MFLPPTAILIQAALATAKAMQIVMRMTNWMGSHDNRRQVCKLLHLRLAQNNRCYGHCSSWLIKVLSSQTGDQFWPAPSSAYMGPTSPPVNDSFDSFGFDCTERMAGWMGGAGGGGRPRGRWPGRHRNVVVDTNYNWNWSSLSQMAWFAICQWWCVKGGYRYLTYDIMIFKADLSVWKYKSLLTYTSQREKICSKWGSVCFNK